MKTLTFAMMVFTGIMLFQSGSLKAINFINVSEKGQVTGKITDKSTGKPVQSASIELYNTDNSKLVVGTITNNKGEFTITMIEPGNYYMEIIHEGYYNFMVNNIQIKDEGGKKEVGEVKLYHKLNKSSRAMSSNRVPVKESGLAMNNK